MPAPQLFLSPPTLADLDALLDFELRNRTFFEAHINARPADTATVSAGSGAPPEAFS